MAQIEKSKFGLDKLEDVVDADKLPTEEEFEAIKGEVYDLYKIAFPIAIQRIVYENVGTPKLELAIDDLMKNKADKPFERFMLTFLRWTLG